MIKNKLELESLTALETQKEMALYLERESNDSISDCLARLKHKENINQMKGGVKKWN